MKIISSLSLKISFLALLFLIICSSAVFSQSFNIDWQSCYGGSDWESPFDILILDNAYLITGSTRSSDGDISYFNGMSDIWLVKISNTGDLLWEKTYGGSQGEGSVRIFEAGEGNYYIMGASNSSDGDIFDDPYPDSWDLWVLKIDSVGNIIWEEIYGGNGDETVWTGITTEDGGLVALVWTASNDGDVSNYYAYYDAWMIKVNSEGEKEWDFTLGTPGMEVGQALIQTSDGGFLAGLSGVLFDGGNLTCTPHSIDGAEAVLVKLDSSLNIEWDRCYGGSQDEGITALAEVDDGYIMGGYAMSNDGDVSGNHGSMDIWIVKLDFEGNIIWQKCLGGSRVDGLGELLIVENSDILLLGYTKSNNGDVSGNHSISEHDRDIWVLRLSSDGALLWEHCFGGIRNEESSFGIHYISENNFIIAGQTDYGPSFDVACTPHGGNVQDKDFWVFEVKDTTVNVQEQLPATRGIRTYPNPARDYVCFEFKSEKGSTADIKIFNNMGTQISNPVLYYSEDKVVWDTRDVNAGVYFYTFGSDYVNHSGKIIIE
ncbi:MAG: T9SS type A sorting domain-containing protein [Clostridia bacterium]|nr:T9SS type A sorting domain-containing protein [Clostridia bacterium]